MPGGDALQRRRGVEGAAQAKHTPKLPLLFEGGEFVLECVMEDLLAHDSLFCLIALKSAMRTV